jgi:hypothetical protein
VLDSSAIELEELYLGLRTSQGVPVQRLPWDTIESWCAQKWATVGTGRVRLTPEGWLRLDALVAVVRSREPGAGNQEPRD